MGVAGPAFALNVRTLLQRPFGFPVPAKIMPSQEHRANSTKACRLVIRPSRTASCVHTGQRRERRRLKSNLTVLRKPRLHGVREMSKTTVTIMAAMIFFTGTTTALPQANTFPSTGNVGIGTTQPTQKLTVGSGNVFLPTANVGVDGNLYFGGITDAGQVGMRLFGGLVNGNIPAGFIDVQTTDPTDGLRIRVDNFGGGSERMRIAANGNVSIANNLLLPSASGGAGGNLYLGGITDTGEIGLRLFGGLVNGTIPAGFIDVRTTDPADGLRIRVDTAVGGTERVRIAANGNVGIGTPNPSTTLDVSGTTRTGVLEITGGADLAEPFEVGAAEAIEPGMLVSIDPDRPGQLRLAKHAYDHAVAGVVSGANGLDPGVTMGHVGDPDGSSLPVALTGRVYALADATNRPIAPGDLLTTSDTPGHAMKVTDHQRARGGDHRQGDDQAGRRPRTRSACWSRSSSLPARCATAARHASLGANSYIWGTSLVTVIWRIVTGTTGSRSTAAAERGLPRWTLVGSQPQRGVKPDDDGRESIIE